jgi:hypothetical protein
VLLLEYHVPAPSQAKVGPYGAPFDFAQGRLPDTGEGDNHSPPRAEDSC